MPPLIDAALRPTCLCTGVPEGYNDLQRRYTLIDAPKTSAAMHLSGMSLPGGWGVKFLIPRPAGRSNGSYSVSYTVENEDGSQGFLKALDYSRAFSSPDPALAISTMTQAYLHERELLSRCGSRNLRRVVRALGSGSVSVPGFEITVNYIIFERADGDLRAQMDALDRIDDAWRARTLHQIATALQELHRLGIAHQDLKPANVLTFGPDNSKVADLGRSVCRDLTCPYENEAIPGTRSYAPPELLYGSPPTDFHRRRFGCDAYLLGSMATYLFTGTASTTLLLSYAHPDHAPTQWADGFDAVLPYLKDAFAKVLETLEGKLNVTVEVRVDLLASIRELCEPDPSRRGHPANLNRPDSQYSVEQYVTRFDLIAYRLEYMTRKAS